MSAPTRPDLSAAWLEWLAHLERTVNQAANSAMSSEGYRKGMNRALLGGVVTHELAHRAIRRLLKALDIPTRDDVAALGDRLRSIEEQLTQLHAILELAHPDAAASLHRPLPSPPRTRQPPAPAGAAHPVVGKPAALAVAKRKKAGAARSTTGQSAGVGGPAPRRRSGSRQVRS
jgi:hypothetical protein